MNQSYKKFMMLWGGELISAIGSGLTAFGLGVYVFRTTHNASSVALVSLLAFLPTILLSAPAGVLADRMDRRLLMILGDGLSAVGLIYILVCIWSGNDTLFNICLGVFISSVFSSLLEPAYRATVTDLLTEEEFSKASGLVQLAGASKFLLSPLLAGLLLNYFTIELLLLIDIITFFLTVLVTFIVRKGIVSCKKTAHHNFMQEFQEGYRAITRNKGVLSLVILMSFVTFAMGLLQTLYTPMILPFSDAKTLGMLQTISATGMLAASFVIGMNAMKKNYTNKLVFGLFFGGIAMAIMGMRANVFVIVIGGFLFFAMLPMINTSADYLVRTTIPNELQGRAWGLIGIISQLGYVLAFAVAGVLADYVFEPMFYEEGVLAGSIGNVIGVGKGRGIAFMIIIAGIGMSIMAMIMHHNKAVRLLERR